MRKLKIMIDSNVFDRIIDDEELIRKLQDQTEIFITNVQKAELQRISDSNKKQKIMDLMDDLNVRVISHPFSFQYLDFENFTFTYSEDVEVFRIGNEKHLEDALIASSAIMHTLQLVTDDNDFRKRMIKNGYSAICYNEFKDMLFE